MRNFFKRTRPTRTIEPKVSIEDVLVLRWYGFTPNEWAALPNHIRTAKRSGYFQARGL